MLLYEILNHLSDIVMSSLSGVALLVCAWSWYRENDYMAISLALPCFYFVAFYVFLALWPQDVATRNVFARAGVALFLIETIIWRVVYIRRKQKRRYGEY